jgi:hypothetical protein
MRSSCRVIWFTLQSLTTGHCIGCFLTPEGASYARSCMIARGEITPDYAVQYAV